MNSRHLVDPELVPMLESFPGMTFDASTLAEARQLMQNLGEAALAEDECVDVTRATVPARIGHPEVQLYIYRPKKAEGLLPSYFYIHGGGYVGGVPSMGAVQSRQLVRDLGCVVIAADYRVAPETPFPGPIEDCYAGLLWLYSFAQELGVDAQRIAVGGDSAGGGLAAALALLARDRGEVSLVLQVLVYPMLDDRTGYTSEPHPYAGEFLWNAQSNRFGWASYLGEAFGGSDIPPWAAPARAMDLAGLPPTFIAIGQLDLFVDENIDYARRLIRAGVSTEFHIYPGAFHSFDLVADATSTKALQSSRTTALRRAFSR
jgi:acetyl esterase/lipase